MPLTHEFAKTNQTNISTILGDVNLIRDTSITSPVVKIDDDYILYFSDSLRWVDTLNPRKDNNHLPHKGLCYYGITLFLPNHVRYFRKIIESWQKMFFLAPDDFFLTGMWTCNSESNLENGEYEKIVVKKVEILNQLSELISLCKEVERDDKSCLFHWGI